MNASPKALLEAMRPHQWVKNLLVFAALVFAHRLGDPTAWFAAATGFIAFCMLASAIYLLNDVVDRHADAAHPKKRNRPIASGRLGVGPALIASVGLVLTALTAGWAVGWVSASAASWGPEGVENWNATEFVLWPFGYAAMNTAYSLYLKRLPIVDCLIVAAGFGIRVHAGSVAIGETSSSWLLLCTFFFALFLAFCKRRDELANVVGTGAAEGGRTTRHSLRKLTLPFLDQIIAPLAALSILSYALYTVAPETVEFHGTRRMIFTVPFVVFGVFRYLLLVYTRDEGDDPARLLFRDQQLIVAGVFWLGVVAWVTQT